MLFAAGFEIGVQPDGANLDATESLQRKYWIWKAYLCVMGLTFVLKIISLDIAGALLSGLMLCIALFMLRNGLREVPRHAMVYCVLCGINFFFDVVPLLSMLGGRSYRVRTPVGTVEGEQEGTTVTTYTETQQTTPFFDLRSGFIYNVQSVALIVSPCAMFFGMCLSAVSYFAVQQLPQDGAAHDENPDGVGQNPRQEEGPVEARAAVTDEEAVAQGAQASQSANSSGRPPGRQESSRATFEQFQGRRYKLN